jgi:predicted dehydrogenase
MSGQVLGIVMTRVTGRTGYRQHLVRSVLAIRERGGVELADGSRAQLEPMLVGRSETAAQWEQFVRHVVDDAPNPYDLLAGARGVQLAEAGLQSCREGRRIELTELGA